MAGLNQAPIIGAPRAIAVPEAAAQFLERRDGRAILAIANTSAVTVYMGTSASLTAANGWPIAAGAAFVPPVAPGDEIWLLAGGAAGSVVLMEG